MQTNNPDWNKLSSQIERIKPDFGTISLELTFHQKKLSKAKILQKQDLIVFDKRESLISKDKTI
jgi:hypothetical protein